MLDTFISPNLHVILIHYPLGVFVLGAIIEIFGFLWPTSSARLAARWMILLGALLMLPAVMSGIYALSEIVQQGSQPLEAAQWHQMLWHIWLESGAAGLAVLIIVIGLGASDNWRNRLHWPMALALLCVLGLMGAGAWFGGEGVYRGGLAQMPSTGMQQPASRFYYYVGDPLQIHVILVGGLLAFTAVAIGLGIRRITLLSAMADESALSPHHIGLGPEPGQGWQGGHGLLPDIESLPPEPRIASTRYWIFAFIFAALTAAAGYWFWGHDGGDKYGFAGFWQDTMTRKGVLTLDRTSAHVWVAMGIIALTLILALVIHFAPPSKLLLTIFAGLLVLLLAAQFWLGILLAFSASGSRGPLLHFNDTHAQVTQPVHLESV